MPDGETQPSEVRIFDFIGFMDHSGSDELTGDADRWHSTALIMAVDDHVFKLTELLAEDLARQRHVIGKWSKRRAPYRKAFIAALLRHLPKSRVFVAAFSARERLIRQNKDAVLDEMQIREIYKERQDDKGRVVSVIGLVFNEKDEPLMFTTLERRAVMLLWIAHFLTRFYFELKRQWVEWKPETSGLAWQLFINKFVGDNERSATAMTFFQGFTSRFFPLRTTFFHESSVALPELVADNLAGLINEAAHHTDRYAREFEALRKSHAFHYETFG